MIKLLHDPTNGALPPGARSEVATTVDFCNQAGGCGRCGGDLAAHVWQLVDTDPDGPELTAQRGVMDCRTGS